MKTVLITLFTTLVFTLNFPAFAEDDHHHNNHDHDHDGYGGEHKHGHGEENSSRIVEEMARSVGIGMTAAGSQELHQTITVFGSIVTAPEQLSHVRARFEGMVKAVKVTLGDRVTSGDVLAEVESNESLKTYTIRSPITGRVIQRHANTGEVTQDQTLFAIANFETLWAELRVYPAQQHAVKVGQLVDILAHDRLFTGTINHLIPTLDHPYQLARIKLDNEDHMLSPGLIIEAQIVVDHFSVALAVQKDAVQTLDGKPGVFIKHDNEYTFTPLVLGRMDDDTYEVLGGLKLGAEYVSQNSYLIKADIEKSEAEHQH